MAAFLIAALAGCGGGNNDDGGGTSEANNMVANNDVANNAQNNGPNNDVANNDAPNNDLPDEVCDDDQDNDGDGDIDCTDADCADTDICQTPPDVEVCGDGQDNDDDGLIDCADEDCAQQDECADTPEGETCDDGQDNDGDDLTDCDDPDCEGTPACIEVCDDDEDNDGDGLADCDDEDCEGAEACIESICGDGQDNDGDDLTDCDDPDCTDDIACAIETCDDGEDNDGDEAVDCDDPDCTDDIACAIEICDDDEDNDGDDLIDCDDPDCADDDCVQTSCVDAEIAGIITAPGRLMGDNTNAPNNNTSGNSGFNCREKGRGNEDIYVLQLDEAATVCIDTLGTTFDTVLYARTDCNDTETEIACSDDIDTNPINATDRLQSAIEIDAAAGVEYSIFVDGYNANDRGPYILTTRLAPCFESVCDDNQDGDEDGLTDCDDPDCQADPHCIIDLCDAQNQPDAITAPGTFTGDTNLTLDLFGVSPQCSSSTQGGESVYTLSVPFETPVCIDTDGSNFRTVLSVREDCDAANTEIACALDIDTPPRQAQVEFVASPEVDYSIIVDGYTTRGQYTLNVEFGTCNERICDDGQDNDSDGLTDCDDPECAQSEACLRPLCEEITMPETITAPGTYTGNNAESPNHFESSNCRRAGGGENVHTLIAPQDTTVCIDAADSPYNGMILYAREHCTDAQSELACSNLFELFDSEIEFDAVAQTPYSIFADCAGSGGDYNLNVRFSPCDESVCDDGDDDDDDGLTDCEDDDCFEHPGCIATICEERTNPNIITAPGSFTGDTSQAPNQFHSTRCHFLRYESGEDLYALSVEEQTTVCISTERSDPNTDTLLYVREECTDRGSEVICNKDARFDVRYSEVEFVASPDTEYTIFVDGHSLVLAGPYTMEVSFGPCEP